LYRHCNACGSREIPAQLAHHFSLLCRKLTQQRWWQRNGYYAVSIDRMTCAKEPPRADHNQRNCESDGGISPRATERPNHPPARVVRDSGGGLAAQHTVFLQSREPRLTHGALLDV
jgi:hypothetical protein